MGDGLRRLGHMQALDSIGDSLEWETEGVRAQTAMDIAAITGGALNGRSSTAETDMGKTLVAGDVHNNNYYGGRMEQPNAAPPAPPQTASAQPVNEEELARRAAEAAYQRLKAKLKQAQAAEVNQTPQPVSVSVQQSTTEPLNWRKYLWPALAAVGLTGTGLLGIVNYFAGDAPVPPAAVDTDTKYEFDMSADKGKGFATSE